MESIGEILSETRKNNNYSLEQVARDTHIAKRFIQALEDEDFSVFPGETYLLGFLRSYSDYLGLDGEEIVTLYKNMKLQEQPVPLNELLDAKPRPKRLIAALFGVAGLLLLGAAAVLGYKYVYPLFRERSLARANESVPVEAKPDVYLFQEEVAVKWFAENTIIRIVLGEEEYDLPLTSVGQTPEVTTSEGTLKLSLGQEYTLDLDSDGQDDLRIVLNATDTSERLKRANLGLYKITTTQAPQVETEDQGVQDRVSVPPIRPSSYQPKVVLRADAPHSFVVEIGFRRYCLFRYVIDGEDRQERFFQKDESVSLEADRELKLWLSNAGAVRAKIQGIEADMGRPGEAATRLIKWVQQERPGSYQLEILPVF